MDTQTDRQLKEDLAAAYRICAALDFHEGVCNHITVAIDHPRASTEAGGSLVIRHGVAWAECTASDLLVFDNHTGEVCV